MGIDGNYPSPSHHFFIKLENWLKSPIECSKLASGVGGKLSTLIGEEGGEGKAECGGTKESLRDTQEVRASEDGQTGLFWILSRQFGVDIQRFKRIRGYRQIHDGGVRTQCLLQPCGVEKTGWYSEVPRRD